MINCHHFYLFSPVVCTASAIIRPSGFACAPRKLWQQRKLYCDAKNGKPELYFNLKAIYKMLFYDVVDRRVVVVSLLALKIILHLKGMRVC